MVTVPSIKLASGYSIPQFGLGTWLSTTVGSTPAAPGAVAKAVDYALQAGYRHIDCAMAYGNQPEVGSTLTKWIQEGKVKREDLFITSKIWNTFHSYENATKAVDMILKDLNLSYMDLCLIHWPQGYDEDHGMFPKDKDGVIMNADTDYLDTWRAMEEAQKAGKIRSLGVSNFNSKQMQRIIGNGGKIDVSQNERNPYFVQTNLMNFCKERGIVFTAFSPLANPSHMFRTADQPMVFDNPVLVEIGKKHGKTVAQVCIRWALQSGTVVIPKSITQSRIEQNIKVMDFELTQDEMNKINGLNKDMRILSLTRDSQHKDYPFTEPF